MDNKCPVCKTDNCKFIPTIRASKGIECLRCGVYEISLSAFAVIKNYNLEQCSIISHIIRKSNGNIGMLTTDSIEAIIKNTTLPNTAELANNLILFLGDNLPSLGSAVEISGYGFFSCSEESINKDKRIFGIIGIRIEIEHDDFRCLIDELVEQKLIFNQSRGLSLTFNGWQKYEELKRSVKDSRKAFMAMEFAKDNSDNYYFQNIMFPKYLKDAVKKTGYELKKLDDEPKAGNIHARMEVEIRSSRFLIAELSHHNNGAYWEAGFARGLGKPVIYMYNKSIGGADKPPHFDVKSDHIVYWGDNKTPEGVSEELKVVIRATLFGEAKMEDD